MSKMLAIISVAGLALCAALLGGAWALGGDDIFHDPRSMEGLKPLLDLATHKEWRWAGGDTLALDAPITVRYEPRSKPEGGKPNVSITGPADAMDHIRVQAGRITGDVAKPAPDAARLQAVVSGIPIRKFVVNGGEKLQLGHIDQEELTVHINGGGSVSGDGKVQNLTLVMNGPGTADLGALQVDDANVSVLGPGNVTLSPHGDVKLFLAGNALVRMLTRPASIKRRVIGSAVIQILDSSDITPGPVAPRAATPATPATPPGAAPMPMPMPVPVPVVPQEPPRPPVGDVNAVTHDKVFVRGSQNVDLGHVDQEHLSVMIGGNGSVKAEGRVDVLDVQIGGNGNANLGGLAARRVVVNIAGNGNATVAPAEELRANILGSGNVRLTTRPQSIERHVVGDGRVIELR